MGTKFANLHVQTEKVEEVIAALKNSGISRSFFVGSFNGWVSVFDERFNWEEIGSSVQTISRLLTYPMLSVGYFDDEVLELGLFQNGQLITKHLAGVGVEEYELVPAEMDLAIFQKVVQGTVDEAQLSAALEYDDLEELVGEMEKALNIPLWMKYEWIEEDGDIRSRFIQIN